MLIFIFTLGLIFGSFYTVVGLRLPANESIFKPGSHCDHCDNKLTWVELIPLVSYIVQRGECRNCGCKIPIYYLLIELLTGVLFALCYALYGFEYEFWAGIIIASILIIIFVSDFKYMIILDSPLVLGTIAIVILKYCYFGTQATVKALVSAFLMFMFLLSIKFIFDKVFKRESLGGGDIKLSLLTGSVLGMKLGLTSLIIASFLALPYAIYTLQKAKEKEIPFGPFLVCALFITFIFMDILTEYIRTFLYF